MGKVLKFIAGAVLTVVGAVTGNPFLLSMGASMALGVASQLLGPKIPKSQLSRLNVSLEPTTPRKTVLGTTAMNTDLRYHEASGTNQEYIDYIIATSAHKVKSIDELWFDDKLAWSAVSGVSSTYSGYLDVAVRTEGTAANTIAINGGFKWGSTRRLTGCSYIWLRIRRTGVTDKVESPLVSGLPNRVTIIGEGGLLYDPRLDSTVAGGSGSHRANDQSTWGTYTSAEDCDNPALQLLWWLLGWRINGQLSVGCGVPPERIDLESFITAANICDEPVTLAAGGTQRRYSTSGTMTDSDNRIDIINTYLGCMNGTLRDSNGRLTVTVLKNDLADYVLDLTDDDILGEFQWNQTRGLTESYNVVRGRYVDPSNNSLYQMVDYPEVRIDSPDGIDRVLSLDLPFVENGNRAQRIAKQFLQRSQYKGTFSAVFTAKALGCQVGDIVLLSFTPLGWDNKPFRVISQQISSTCQVPLELVEENADIYAWDNDERALVQPTAPTIYDPLNNPFILGVADAALSADWPSITGTGKPEDNADVTSEITGAADIVIDADYTGAITSALPRTSAYKLFRNGADITGTTTWSVSVLTGVISASIGASTGVLSVNTSSGNLTNSTVRIIAVNGTRTRTLDVGIRKVLAAAPSTGGTGGTSASSSFAGDTTTDTMVAISPELTITIGTVGQASLAASYEFNVSTNGSYDVFARWYRWNGSAYVAIGSEVQSSVPAIWIAADLSGEAGYGSCNLTDTGLTATSTQKYRLYMRNTSGTVTRTISGSVSAVGS